MIRNKIQILVLLMFFCLPGFHHAWGAQYLHSIASSSVSSGMAGTGVSGTGQSFYFLNPAALASVERYSLSLNYGSLDSDFYHPLVVLSIPTSYGVFSGGFSQIDGQDEFQETSQFYSLGMGKSITDNFAFGFSIDGVDSEESSYIGAKMGFRYRIPFLIVPRGFTIYEPVFAVSGQMGYFDNESANYNSVTAGYNFQFYRQRNYFISFNNDYSYYDGEADKTGKFGLEFTWNDRITFRGGFVLPRTYEYMEYSGGISLNFKTETSKISIDYGSIYSRENSFNHYAGLTVEYGDLDREGPKTGISINNKYISPNHDGVQDYFLFTTEVSDRNRIKGWRLEILDSANKPVKEFRISDRDIDRRMTVSSFAGRVFGRRESIVVPEKILWDGKGEDGKILPDGKYSYHFYAWDSKDNIATVRKEKIFIDTKSPVVKINYTGHIFSPNGDGNRDRFIVRHKIDTSPIDEWQAVFKDEKGEIVRNYKWKGHDIPAVLKWDGRDNSGSDLPDGLYSYEIASSDNAGNNTKDKVKEIVLVRSFERADVTISKEYHSYRLKNTEKLRFFPELSKKVNLEKWDISILNDSKKVIRVISGGSELPGYVDWDGLDKDGDTLSDGEYYVVFNAKYRSGNNPKSFPKKIIFDSTSPEVSIDHDPLLFSPDDDGFQDFLNIVMDSADSQGVDSWNVNIISENGQLFKTFSGEGNPPESIKWDGVGDNEELVESASDYSLELTCRDFAGNISKRAVDRFFVDVLVVVTERGLKMRISNIQFPFGSSRIKKRGRRILDRVHSILEKYKKYDVIVEGHTDDIGKELYNIKLSEARALSVKKYLIDQGSDSKRLRSRGFGETMPFYPNNNAENRRRNRRVEFLLRKSGDDHSEVRDIEDANIKGDTF